MSGLKYLLSAQFLSAFVDNMILFIAQAVILRDAFPAWYLDAVQATFLFSYIVLSPWAGRLADRYPKRRMLFWGNIVKCAGVAMFIGKIDPALSYAVVGIGAVLYSPAKYGILPWMTGSDKELLQANSYMEGFTILAILTGAAAGGWLADYSVFQALLACVGIYLISSLLCAGIPSNPGDATVDMRGAVASFCQDFTVVLQKPEGLFSLLGTSGFWLASAVLRLSVFAWLPVAFGIHDNATIGIMIMLSGAGLICGAVLTPRLVPPGKSHRVIVAGALMGLSLIMLPWVTWLQAALLLQTICGSFGGIYVIPLNAMLQRVGETTVGTGKIIAIQNFSENVFMFAGVLCFLAASSSGVPVAWSMIGNGIVLLCVVGCLYWLHSRQKK